MKIMFRSLGLVAVLALSTLLPSCDKVKDAIRINIPTQTVNADFQIGIVSTAGTVQESGFQWGINLDSTIKVSNPDLGISNIKQAKIKSIVLTLNNADQTDKWSSFSSAEAGFASNAGGTVGSFTTFASIPSIAESYSSTSLEIPVSDIDFKDQFNATIFYYKLKATARRATSKVLTGTATIKFDVVAGL
ncbi:MAG TPA: hypothetical protein VIM79_03445 [Niastella sp.]